MSAYLEKYACGIISPKKVITTVEKINAATPTMTELESRVSRTFMHTLPQRMVVSRKFESSLSLATFMAFGSFFLVPISSWSLEILKKARLSPENIADCVMQNKIPSHISVVICFYLSFFCF